MPKLDFKTMPAKKVLSYLREKVREFYGDDVENNANIFASRGYYSVNIPRPNDFTIAFSNFRKGRVPEIVDNLKMLAGK